MEFIEKYPDKPWDWNSISYNPNITIEFIEKHSDKPWNWYYNIYKSKYYYRNYRKIFR